MDIYLVQRGTFKTIDINDIVGIDSLINFDYMGSSEFEFGAMPKSLKRIMTDVYTDNFKCYKIIINKEEFIVFSKTLLDNGKEVENFMQKAYEEKYVHTKGLVNIDRYFEGEEVWKLKKGCVNKKEKVTNYGYCNFWWDIDNDWIVVPNAHSYPQKITQAFSKLKEKGFGK